MFMYHSIVEIWVEQWLIMLSVKENSKSVKSVCGMQHCNIPLYFTIYTSVCVHQPLELKWKVVLGV